MRARLDLRNVIRVTIVGRDTKARDPATEEGLSHSFCSDASEGDGFRPPSEMVNTGCVNPRDGGNGPTKLMWMASKRAFGVGKRVGR